LEAIWENRPELPTEKAYLLDVNTTGQSTKDKISTVKSKLKDKRADVHFVCSLDDVAWILNICGNDVDCNPVVLGFLLIQADKNTLFIGSGKLSSADISTLKDSGVEVADYQGGFEAVKQLKGERILLDPKRTCFAIYDSVPENIEILEDMNPSTSLRSEERRVGKD